MTLCGSIWRVTGRVRTRQRPVMKSLAVAENHGARKVRDVPASERFEIRFGVVAGRFLGPKPRNYGYKLPRKMFHAALRSALTVKLRDSELSVVEAFDLESHRTKLFEESLRKLGFTRKVLLVDHEDNPNLRLASRNLAEVSLIPSLRVTPYQLLASRHVVFTKAAIQGLQEVLTKEVLRK